MLGGGGAAMRGGLAVAETSGAPSPAEASGASPAGFAAGGGAAAAVFGAAAGAAARGASLLRLPNTDCQFLVTSAFLLQFRQQRRQEARALLLDLGAAGHELCQLPEGFSGAVAGQI